MATTTNYGWTTPDDTALVKDGASAIRTLGSSIDTTTKALNPSTTLGDIEYRSSTANTNTRLPIGTSGQVLAVSGGVPAWTTSSSGSMTLLSTTTLSGATVTVSSISQAYKNLYIQVLNPTWATGIALPRFRYDASSSFQGTSITTNGSGQGIGTNYVNCWGAQSSNTAADGQFQIIIYNYATTTSYPIFYSSGVDGSGTCNQASGVIFTLSGITQVQITNNQLYSYNGGTLKIYGVN